jgi:hypothetical protein
LLAARGATQRSPPRGWRTANWLSAGHHAGSRSRVPWPAGVPVSKSQGSLEPANFLSVARRGTASDCSRQIWRTPRSSGETEKTSWRLAIRRPLHSDLRQAIAIAKSWVLGHRLDEMIGGHLKAVLVATTVAGLTFVSGMVGLHLQKRLPKHHMTGGSKDMILAVIGLVTLLLALVLGTLIGNTYSFFATQKSELELMASRVLLVDQALAQFGPETKPARDKLKESITQSYELFWHGAESDPSKLKVGVALKRWQLMSDFLNSLDPKTAAQKDAIASAKENLALMEQTRLLMSLQLSSPIALSLVISVVAWSMFLFCGFGVLSGTNPTTIVALALGSISVAGGMYLILDLSQPYSGYFRIPPTAIEQTIEAID